MTSAGKLSVQPSVRNHLCQTNAQNALAHAQNISIVMLTGHLRRENIAAQCSADALAFISSNGNTNTGAADKNTSFCTTFTASDILAELFSEIRIIYRILAVGTMVNNLDTLVLQIFFDVLFQMKAAMIAAHCNFHVSSLLLSGQHCPQCYLLLYHKFW